MRRSCRLRVSAGNVASTLGQEVALPRCSFPGCRAFPASHAAVITSIEQRRRLLPLGLLLILAVVALPALFSASGHAAPTASPSSTVPTIVCFGDSITSGYGVNPGESYPDDLRTKLHARGYRYHVLNMGVGGNTTKDAVGRLPQVLRVHPAVVVVEFGGNDGLRGLPLTDTQRNLDTITGTLLRAGSKVLLVGITLPPNYGPSYIHQFDSIYVDVARKYKVPLMPMIYANIYNVPGAVQADGIHPTAKGAGLIAENIMKKLLPMLERPGSIAKRHKR